MGKFGKCSLCGKNNVGLIRGHIVPSWVYGLSETLENFFEFGVKNQDEFVFNNEILHRSKLQRERMFCNTDESLGQGCDQKIGVGEDEIKNVFIEGINFKNVKGRFPYKIIKPDNFPLITRGLAGILLKLFISNKFQLADHFKPDNYLVEILKEAVNNDSLSSKIIKFAVVKYYRPQVNGRNLESAYYLNLSPSPNPNLFFLNFGGLLFLIQIDISSNIVDDKIKILAKEMPYVNLKTNDMDFLSAISIKISDEEFSKDFTFIYRTNPKDMSKHPDVFNQLTNPDNHLLLNKNWFKANFRNLKEGCICGNKERLFETCCQRVWQL